MLVTTLDDVEVVLPDSEGLDWQSEPTTTVTPRLTSHVIGTIASRADPSMASVAIERQRFSGSGEFAPVTGEVARRLMGVPRVPIDLGVCDSEIWFATAGSLVVAAVEAPASPGDAGLLVIKILPAEMMQADAVGNVVYSVLSQAKIGDEAIVVCSDQSKFTEAFVAQLTSEG